MDDFRSKVLQKGCHAIKDLNKMFNKYDKNRSWSLCPKEFAKVVADFDLDLSKDACRKLFEEFDNDGNGKVSFEEFLLKIRGQLAGKRLEAVKEVFRKIDITENGIIDAEDMKIIYKEKGDRNFQQFMKRFEPDPAKRKGKITEDEFIDYYAGVSVCYDNDKDFVDFINYEWKI